MADATYLTKVGFEQGASTLFVQDSGLIDVAQGGGITLASGGVLTLASGATFTNAATQVVSGDQTINETATMTFFTEAFTGAALRYAELSQITVTQQNPSTAEMSNTNSIISPAYGYHHYSAGTGYSKLSQKLPSANRGAVLVLDFQGFVGSADISLWAASGGGVAGVSLNGFMGGNVSSLEVSLLSAVPTYVKMVCNTTGLWQIVEKAGSVTERAAS